MKVVYSKSAEKDILTLERSLGQRIFKKTALLKDQPFGFGSQNWKAVRDIGSELVIIG